MKRITGKPYKISVMINDDFYVKAVSLSRQEASEITDELIILGFIARFTPHVW